MIGQGNHTFSQSPLFSFSKVLIRSHGWPPAKQLGCDDQEGREISATRLGLDTDYHPALAVEFPILLQTTMASSWLCSRQRLRHRQSSQQLVQSRTSSAVNAARQSWMLAGFVLAVNQLLMPPLLSFTSGRLRPRNTSYLRKHLGRDQPRSYLPAGSCKGKTTSVST